MKIGKPKSNTKEFVGAIKKAREICPNSDFIDSVEDFFNKNGYLTPKQVEALEDIKPKSYDYEDSFYPNYFNDPDDFF